MKIEQIDGDFGDPWGDGATWWCEENRTLYHIHGTSVLPDTWDEPHKKGATQPVYEVIVDDDSNYGWEIDIASLEGCYDIDWEEQSNEMKTIYIGSYYGWYNLDSDPYYYNKTELKKLMGLYRVLCGCDCRKQTAN